MSLIYTLDSETDPFLRGRNPQPFAWNLYDGTKHFTTWGRDCTAQILAELWRRDPGIVYLHNGGKFDIFYLLPAIDTSKDMLIIKERITQCFVKCKKGHHKLRDSLKILPFSLDTYQKTKIDYALFEADMRDTHRDEITAYLKDDCKFLYDLVIRYIQEFGISITIGGTAIKELKKFHYTGNPLSADTDEWIRKRYYMGARVERYKTGVFDGAWKCYDVNSMYPHVMRSMYHPIDTPTHIGKQITKDTFFVTAQGFSRGAFPIRTKEGIRFPHEENIYSVTIHEWNAAKDLGLFDAQEIIETVDFGYSNTFCDYVDHFYGLRQKATLGLIEHLKVCGNCNESEKTFCDVGNDFRILALFYKFLLNNSYGRFAINPDNFKEYRLTDDETDLRFFGFNMAEIIEGFRLLLWSKPSSEAKYNNVATGASITGGARSILMRGLHSAVEPIYCDTDSLICRDFKGEVDASQLGAWKLEKTGNRVAIAGRKMYALFQDEKCLKYASKGVRIAPEDVERIARGEEITYLRDAPTYRLNGSVDWLKRTVRIR